VRALVRDTASSRARALATRGVDLVAGALDDRASLAAAMRGTQAVFALTTPFEDGVDVEVAQGRAIVAAAHDARVPHLVFSSVAGADTDSGVLHFQSKARIEAELAGGEVPFTVLGPTYFFDNALGGAQDICHGVLQLPHPADRPLQQLARTDLGAFASKVLRAPDAYGHDPPSDQAVLTPRHRGVAIGRPRPAPGASDHEAPTSVVGGADG
jgi:uncharacterized protein YbjT (DUF2867 family)